MRTRLMGFSFDLPNGMTTDGFWAELTLAGSMSFEGFDRYFLGEVKDGLLLAVLLTTKDHRKFVETKTVGGRRKVVKRSTTDGHDGTEFNFVAVNPTTRQGVIQVSRGAFSLSLWGRYLAKVCDRYREKLILDEVDASNPTTANRAKAFLQAQRKYRGFFHFKEKLQTKDLPAILRQVKGVSQIEFPVEWSDLRQPSDTPLSLLAPTLKKTISFDRRVHPFGKVKAALLNWWTKPDRPATARIFALTDSGDLRWFDIGENLVYFGTEDYDDYVEDLPDEWENFATSDAMSWVIDQMHNHGRQFGLAK